MIVLKSLWKYIFALSPGPVHETLMSVCRFTTCLSWLTSLGECCTASNSACLYMWVTAFREEKVFSHLEIYSTSWPDFYVKSKNPQKAQQILKKEFYQFYKSLLLNDCLLNISFIRVENVGKSMQILCELLHYWNIQILEVGHSCYAVAFLKIDMPVLWFK